MRATLLLLFAGACSNPWYAVRRESLDELSYYRLADRAAVGLRAERVSDDARVVLRSSDLGERRDTDAAGHVFVRMRRPLLGPGIVMLSVGAVSFAIGTGLLVHDATVNGRLSGTSADPWTGMYGSITAVGGVIGIIGAAFLGASLHGRPQVQQPGRLPVELGAWPIPHAPVADPD